MLAVVSKSLCRWTDVGLSFTVVLVTAASRKKHECTEQGGWVELRCLKQLATSTTEAETPVNHVKLNTTNPPLKEKFNLN